MSSLSSGQMYHALRLHFTSKYDFFKYQGKTRIKTISNSHLEIFGMLDRRYSTDLQNFYVSNLIENPKIWIGELLSNDCDKIFKEWNKKNSNLTYIYKQDIINLLEEVSDINDLILIKDDFPLLMQKVMQEKIQLETLLIMNSVLRFFPLWNRDIKDDIFWPGFKNKCFKYYPFLKFNKDDMKSILKNEVKKLI
jgi:hypothetical protein